jgi:aryl-alcohol dehydrogenase-like predicted oxidoreductase
MTAAYYDTLEALTAWAEAHGRAMNELAQVWLLAQAQVCSVLFGATRLQHVLLNAKAASWSLTQDELTEVNALLDQGGRQR